VSLVVLSGAAGAAALEPSDVLMGRADGVSLGPASARKFGWVAIEMNGR
jgi:hypothetical protein